MEKLHGNSSVYHNDLGLIWDTGTGDFIFDFEIICRTAERLDVAKWNILLFAALVFDPLGLISPIILQPKLIFQEICKSKLEWHEIINNRGIIDK